MASERQDQLHALLPLSIQAAAIDLTSRGVFEFAYPASMGAVVVDAIVVHGWRLLGGDLWQREDDRLEVTHLNWHTGRDESASDAVAKAVAFVRTYHDDGQKYVSYVFTRVAPI
jgi:hypothetical protein